jgi:putative DNA primase/helicase
MSMRLTDDYVDAAVASSYLEFGATGGAREAAIKRLAILDGYTREAVAAMVDASLPRVFTWTEAQARRAKARLDRPRPQVIANQDPGLVIARTREALEGLNKPPVLFRHSGALCRIGFDDDGRVLLCPLGLPGIRAELATWIEWVKALKGGGTSSSAVPPIAVDDLASRADALGFIPVVQQVVTAPVFAPDGTLETEPGYIASARVWFEPIDGMVLPPVPERPAREQVDAAVRLLLAGYLGDFPLRAPSDWAHVLALMLLPFVRTMIDGPTPNHGASAPTPGTGKGKLVSAALLPALGRMLPATPEPDNETELKKHLTAIFLAGQQVIRFDNLSAPMRSPAVSMALTEPIWQERVLGVSSSPAQRVRAIWVMTGNNLTYSQEIARRTVPILLSLAEVVVPVADPDGKIVLTPQLRAAGAAHAERPWQRTGFTHPDLLGWGMQHRGELVAACLTIVRGWLAAGRPPFAGSPLGSYEEWSRVIGGIVTFAGVPGFLEGTDELYDSAVSDADEKAGFCERWLARFGEVPVSVADLVQFAGSGADPFGIAAGWLSGRSAETAAGMALRHLDGAVHGGILVRRWGRRGYVAQRIPGA